MSFISRQAPSAASALIVALLLAACGGGGGNSSSGSNTLSGVSTTQGPSAATVAGETSAPAATGNTATDGIAWFNYRRQQMGLPAFTRDARIDKAAAAHSNYQRLNNTITHDETQGLPGFTGVSVGDRLVAASYTFNSNTSYAYGEVISSTPDTSGFIAAEDLIAAIYHRFVVMEPTFKGVGGGVGTVTGGNTYFTADFTAYPLTSVLGKGKMLVYPFASQQRVPRSFFSDNELPDPVPGRNEVGYPISVHADITSTVTVQSFTVAPRNGAPLTTRLLVNSSDAETPTSAAAIVPLNVLSAGTTYDVQFTGTVDGAPVTRSWSFTTQ
ncbi:Uncharacterized conserved protein YkwD, contains CAP (CSP/antigen 5/PR1) domain [Noviherbaspirillum humi]|uniref:Uncharacterized conserved protein YkwD, contains CAP (CSP/antigen 5/PR1) domain n=1 Tax=Noviherbaspirillum humi TaxID=1688639 RepID=A0A239C2D3_9BURK|nr:CAP domain-containing protein [Noviherbaspirillum humi]SNS14052.1 Uncharacterized conserved protein YkwD, contains CAP (CSP/antigen 5/PR1) domain [Noviherbaspirillum humi]